MPNPYFEHPKHALRDEKTTCDIDGREEGRDDAEHHGDKTGLLVYLQEAADDNDPAYRIGTLIKGVAAAVTLQMTCQPTKTAKANTVTCCKNLVGASNPGSGW